MHRVYIAMLQSLRQGLVMALFLSLTGKILFQANFAHYMLGCGIGFTLVLFALAVGEILTSDAAPNLYHRTDALAAGLRSTRGTATVAVQNAAAVQLAACANRPLRRVGPTETPQRPPLSEILAVRAANADLAEFDAIELQLSS
jgi:hypothetical protein